MKTFIKKKIVSSFCWTCFCIHQKASWQKLQNSQMEAHFRWAILDGASFSPCQQLVEDMQKKVLAGAYIPRCTEQGDFDRRQCWGSTGECWCVDHKGAEIEHTRTMLPNTPDCEASSKQGNVVCWGGRGDVVCWVGRGNIVYFGGRRLIPLHMGNCCINLHTVI